MKAFLSLLFIFSSFISLSQPEPEERYYFHTNIEDGELLTVSKNAYGTVLVTNANNAKETEIYAQYKVFDFGRAFPNTNNVLLKNVYTIVTNKVELLGALQYNFPEKYTRIDQFYPDEKPFYPNDYGSTSPTENLGTENPLYDLDQINAPKAWGITRGSKKVVIGISDAKIDSTNADMKGRVSNYLTYSNANVGMNCAHGTNIAGIAIASMDNAYGRPGICPECDVITIRYGSFKYVEDLVAAGAKVINTSWVFCNMGPYHENIEARINELYDDGILIVAAAGNAKGCNGDDYAPDDYVYPASFEKVISVTGVFSIYDTEEEYVFTGKEGKKATHKLKDRHLREYGFNEDGSIYPKYTKWGMQRNNAVDICAPAETYLLGSHICYGENKVGGATSAAAPFVTGVIGLIWSENYCLSSYEVESILKLSAEEIENLPGNERFKTQLGAGRVDAYRAVKMARETKELFGNVEISGRDFYRFNFKLENAPHTITIRNQTFRDSSSVDFKARNAIVLKPNTVLRPTTTDATIKLSIGPNLPTEECFPSPPKEYDTVYKKKRPGNNTNSNNNTSKAKKEFRATYNKNTKSVVLNPPTNKRKDKGKYKVQVLNSNGKIIRSRSFTFPGEKKLPIEASNSRIITVKITFDGKTEKHPLKI